MRGGAIFVCRVNVKTPRVGQKQGARSVCLLTSCSGESCSMSTRRHLRPGRKWLIITSSEMTVQEVKDWKFGKKSLDKQESYPQKCESIFEVAIRQ